MTLPDEDIIDEVLAGDRQLFAELVMRYQKPIFNLMYRHTHNMEEAADLSQDVFIKVFDRLWTFRTNRRFFPWLYGLALNRVRDWHRKEKRRIEYPAHDGLDHYAKAILSDQQQHVENQEKLLQLQEAIHLLPEETRELLILRYQHECSIREVATVFGLSESSTKMRIKRGLAKLHALLTTRQNHD